MKQQTARIENATLERLFEVAIALERQAEALYSGFAERFAHCYEAVLFWRRYAADEVVHRTCLERLRDSLPPDKLGKPADGALLAAGERLLEITPFQRVAGLANLDDAYELSHELESSETNVIFRFLVGEFSHDKRVIARLADDLERHVEALVTAFPTAYRSRASRQAVEPLS